MKVSVADTNAVTISSYSFCGFSNPATEGHRRKCEWLRKRFAEGLRFKILQVGGEDAGMIEYTPGEYAWRPIEADGYMVIHCIKVQKKKHKGKGYGKLLLDECVRDAKQAGMQGVAVVTSGATWMADERVFARSGFVGVDEAPPSFKLMVKKSHNAPSLHFVRNRERALLKRRSGFVIFTSDQCPYVAKGLADILGLCAKHGVEPKVVEMKTSKSARKAPSAYGVSNIAYDGKLVADRIISGGRFRNILRKLGLK